MTEMEIFNYLDQRKNYRNVNLIPNQPATDPNTIWLLRPPRPAAGRSTGKFRQNTPLFGIIAISSDFVQIFAARKGGILQA